MYNNTFQICCIVAISRNNVIGDGKNLLWSLPNDMKRLKNLTYGNPLIMGRKTHDSIGKPLPGRANIVMTRNIEKNSKDVFFVNSFNQAINVANKWIKSNFEKKIHREKKIFIFGGGEIYNLSLKYCHTIEMTIVDLFFDNGVKFPIIDKKNWKEKIIEVNKSTDDHPGYSFLRYERKFN